MGDTSWGLSVTLGPLVMSWYQYCHISYRYPGPASRGVYSSSFLHRLVFGTPSDQPHPVHPIWLYHARKQACEVCVTRLGHSLCAILHLCHVQAVQIQKQT